MSTRLAAEDKSALIRLASSLPKGSDERRAVLAALSKSSAEDKVQVLNENGRKVWVTPETLKGPDKSKYKPIKEDSEAPDEDVKKKTTKGLSDLNKALDGSGAQLKPSKEERGKIEDLVSSGADLNAITKAVKDGDGDPSFDGSTKKLWTMLNKMFEG